MSAGYAHATEDQVVLESFDGSIRLSGALVSFDGQTFVVRTSIGPVSVDAAEVLCEGASCPEVEAPGVDVRISGSRNLATTLMPALLEAFSLQMEADILVGREAADISNTTLTSIDGETLANVSVVEGGSSRGLRELAEGAAHLALTTRPITAAEVDAVAAAGLGAINQQPFETVLALDGLAVVVSRDNPIRALTQARIADVFAGRISNWRELGGPNAEIELYTRARTSGTGAVFDALVMRPTRQEVSGTADVLDSDAAVSDAVANDPFGIGFTSYSNERSARSIAIQGVCGIQTPATAFTIKTEEYPLTRRLYLYRPDRRLPQPATDFLRFIGSATAQEIVSLTGLVDQDVSAQSVNNMGLRFVASVLPSDAETTLPALQNMMQDLIAADRLSITFRFEQGSSRLDSRAEADVARLADMINTGALQNKEVLLIGFTDSVGRADINAELSVSRADQVRDTLLAALDTRVAPQTNISALGYGEMSPLGCNETANGRRINRRVEVWTRDIVR
ncbi:MAG: phosphate ABC transporter substrate-binding/OmpA family protein [Pseudomonadota bacterium]